MRVRIRHRKKAVGFTLFEVLLTILLITTTFMALAQAISLGLFASGNNESFLMGTYLAQEKMEEIKNKSYSSITNEAKATVTGFTTFQREVAVSVPQTNLKEITVTVYWFNKGDELNTSLVTYVSNI